MADVTINYKGSKIAEFSGGSKTLKTAGTYCEGDISVVHTPRFKIYEVNVPTAVAAQFVTLVTGDPDVAAHYADDTAMVTVRKMTNNTSVGTAMIIHTNHAFPYGYGMYMNQTGSANNCATLGANLSNNSSGMPFVRCTSAGEIKVQAQRTSANFGGANYIITFSW